VIRGPESITHAEQARIIGEAVGREVRRQDLPVETARRQLVTAWGNPAFVEALLEAWRGFVDSPERVTDTVERLLGRPTRTFRSWTQDHADDFMGTDSSDRSLRRRFGSTNGHRLPREGVGGTPQTLCRRLR
jgi:hypothetical protein